MRIRKGSKQCGVDDAEDRGVGADAKSECENSHGGEPGILQSAAESEAEIAE